jgi:hypothetical protein
MRRGILRPVNVQDPDGFDVSYPVNAANKQMPFWRWRYIGPSIFDQPVLIGDDGEFRDSGVTTAGFSRSAAFFYTAQKPWSFDFATYEVSATNGVEALAEIVIITFFPPFFSDAVTIFEDADTGLNPSVSGSFATAEFPATDSPLGVLITYRNEGETGAFDVSFDVQPIT